MLAISHKPEQRKPLIYRVLILWKPAKAFVAVGIPKNDNLGSCEDPRSRPLSGSRALQRRPMAQNPVLRTY